MITGWIQKQTKHQCDLLASIGDTEPVSYLFLRRWHWQMLKKLRWGACDQTWKFDDDDDGDEDKKSWTLSSSTAMIRILSFFFQEVIVQAAVASVSKKRARSSSSSATGAQLP